MPAPSRPRVAGLPILTPRLRLRVLREDDADALYAILAEPGVAAWIGVPTPETVANEVRFHVEHQARHGWSIWAVEDRTTGRLVGDCGLQPLELRGPEVELAYDLHPDAWGRGLATEAARATLDAAFGPLGLERVVAVIKPANAASRRVLEKAGLTHAGAVDAYGERMLRFEAHAPEPHSARR